MTLKCCSCCHEEKPLDDFCIQRKSKDGKSGYCRVCSNAREHARWLDKALENGTRKILYLPGFKRCGICGNVLSFEHFYNNISQSDGKAEACKPCSDKATKQWQIRNQEHVKEHRRERYEDEKNDAYQKWKKWRERKIEKEGEAFLMHEKEINRKSCRDNREKNRDQRRINNIKRKAIRHGCTEHFTADQWESLCQQHNNVCLSCGEKKPLTADHVVPLSLGGSDIIDNIQPLCGSCNSRKRTKTIDYRHGITDGTILAQKII